MSSESIPVGLRSLLSKHYFLAQISHNQKPCLSNMTLIDSSSWTGALYRFWYGESRKTGISDIENIISQTIDAIATHKNKPAFLRLIINALASTRVGLESMITTYRDDPAMIGRLQVQLTNIDLQLEEHRDLIKGYSKSSEDGKTIEKAVDSVVESSDAPDKEGLRKFLLGQQLSASGDSNSNNNSNSTNSLTETSDKDRRRRRRQKDVEPIDITME